MIKTGEKNEASKANLPVKKDLAILYILSMVSVILIGLVTLSSLLNQARFYPNEALVQTFLPNDVVYLAIGVPIFLMSMYQSWRSKRIGLLFWVGALLFALYNSIAYVYALPLDWAFLIHLLLVVQNGYALLYLLAAIDGDKLANQLRGHVYEKVCGGVLASFGALFLLRAVVVFSCAIISGEILNPTEIAPSLSDVLTAPGFVIVGIALWRKKTLGYIGALGFLFLASMLFVALLVFFLLQPLLTNAPFAPADFLTVFAMGFVCFVPSGLFIRSAIKSGLSS